MSLELYPVKFINREVELKELQKFAERGVVIPLYIYGPEGCGKTRLLREFVKRAHGIAIYIDALERKKIDKALLTNEVLGEVKTFFKEFIKETHVPLGTYLANKIFTLLERIHIKVTIKGKPLIVAVDDVVQALGLDEIERYIKWLYELIGKVYDEYNPSSVLIIATTSEGLSLHRISRHTYTEPRLLWNLNHDAFIELSSELKSPNSKITDEVWRFTAGNPRALISIAYMYEWNIKSWLEHLKERLRPIISEIKQQGLDKELRYLLEDPDSPWSKTSEGMLCLYNLLIENNLFMYTGYKTLANTRLKPEPELGIGKYYAWQLPAYRYVLEELLKR